MLEILISKVVGQRCVSRSFCVHKPFKELSWYRCWWRRIGRIENLTFFYNSLFNFFTCCISMADFFSFFLLYFFYPLEEAMSHKTLTLYDL